MGTTPVETSQRLVPTYTRVWEYRWVIRGIPNGPTFWRPIEGQAAVTFGVTMFACWLLFKRILHMPLGLTGAMIVYLGIPAAVGWYVSKAKLHGKRLDQWLVAWAGYRWGPKSWDRFRPVAEHAASYTLDGQIVVDDRT